MAENGGRKGSVFMIWPPKRALLRTEFLRIINKIAQYHNYVSTYIVLVPPKSESAKAKNYTAKFAVTGLDQA